MFKTAEQKVIQDNDSCHYNNKCEYLFSILSTMHTTMYVKNRNKNALFLRCSLTFVFL
jgi:hypothetical protein